MEFNEKLCELRKQKGLTQEELANVLFVSRAAISKWESGRGYPNIDSLRQIAKLFSVSIDELLSGEELLTIAQDESKQKENHFRDLVFGLLDISVALFFFMPLFGQNVNGRVETVSLLNLTEIHFPINFLCYAVVISTVFLGVLTLALQNCNVVSFRKSKSKISLALNALAVILFIITRQPYAAVLLFVFSVIKVLMLLKK